MAAAEGVLMVLVLAVTPFTAEGAAGEVITRRLGLVVFLFMVAMVVMVAMAVRQRRLAQSQAVVAAGVKVVRLAALVVRVE